MNIPVTVYEEIMYSSELMQRPELTVGNGYLVYRESRYYIVTVIGGKE